ncbi:Uncharacterised protein [Mycobacteroides abscessus subsp. massiliense]|nr:Uncharacterised protein [Mycobacteroides abscessus subsp. massiliense]
MLVESAGVCPLHVVGDTAETALEDLSVLVDQDVVGDVAPLERFGVIRVDRPDDRRGIVRRIVVTSGGVVDHARAHISVVNRWAAV